MLNKTFSKWLKIITAAAGVTVLVALGVTPSNAVSTNPIPACADGVCYVSFDYSGDYYYWTPPSGINSLHFEVYGAQGGRSGGRGGAVTGDFQALTTPLYIYVGGAGGQGNAAVGGFNGGGTAGSGHADAGSGGGSSDIRLSTSLADRVVVAGGGGGTGGWIGGAGGPGGLTIATAGTKGSANGTAGGGGSQTAGGIAGLGVTTGNGTAGTLATGGTGGNGSVAGGGGGGGGFYGGGGGGSDSVSGGSDGAGGGGGSSFATLALTSNISHQAGAKVGSGQVILRYTYAPKVLSFQSTGRSELYNSTYYRIGFDQYVYGVDPEDFIISGTASSGCFVNNIYGDGYTYEFEVAGCSNGLLNLSLRSNSIMGATPGPVVSSSANPTVIDTVNPGFQISAPSGPTNSQVVKFTVTADEPFMNPGPTPFSVAGAGCIVSSWPMTSANTMEVSITGCRSGVQAGLFILPWTIRDLQGNLGPRSMVGGQTVLVDRDAPTVASMVAESPMADLIPYRINFNEDILGLDLAALTTDDPNCRVSKVDGGGTQFQVWLAGCLSTPNLTLKANSVRDSAGNFGPLTDVVNGTGSVDQTPPTVTFHETSRADRGVSPSFEITFNEPVEGFSLNSLIRTGTARGCTFSLTEISSQLVYQLQSSSCEEGSLRLALPANSVSDGHGNLGPLITTESALVAISLTPVDKTANPVSAAAIKASNTHEPGNLLTESPKPSSTQTPANYKDSEQSFESLAVKTIGQVPTYGWVGLAVLIIGLRLARRLIQR